MPVGPTLPTSKSLDSIALALLGLQWAYLANQQIIEFHCGGPTGPSSGLPCQQGNHWIQLLWAYWACLGSTLATSKSLASIALGDWAYLGPSLPTSKSLLLWAYWAYLGHTLPTRKSLDSIALGLLDLLWAPLATQQILRFHCSGPTGPTLGIPCQPANQWIP